MRIVAVLLNALITLYRVMISPWLGVNCRYQPTCSVYAQEAILHHGPVKGLWLAVRRLSRCHPWGGHGYDPVPPATVTLPPKVSSPKV